MQETESAVATPEPGIVASPDPSVTVEPEATPAEPVTDDAAGEVEDSGAELGEPESLDEWLAQREDHKSAYDLRMVEAKEEGRRLAQSEMQPRLEKINQRFQEYAADARVATQGYTDIFGLLNKAVEDGVLDARTIAQALNASPSAWQAYERITQNAGWFDGMRQVAALLSQSLPSEQSAQFIGDYVTRLNRAQGGAEDAGQVVKDLVKEYTDAEIAKAVEPYRKRVKVLEAQIEKAKSGSRAGQGPSVATGQVGSVSNDFQKRLDRLSLGRDSDGNTPTAEDRAWLAARE